MLRGAITELRDIGTKPAATVDWPAIPAGTEEAFLVRPGETRPEAYGRSV